MNQTLYQRLLPVVKRIRFRRTMLVLAALWFGFAVVVAALFGLNQAGHLDVTNWWLPLVVIATFSTLIMAFASQKSRRDFDSVVRELEQQFPDLDAGLLTAMEQRGQRGKPLGYLQQDVIRQAVNHSFANDWRALIPGWQLFAAPVAGFLGLFAFACAMALMTFNAKPPEVASTLQFSEVAVQNVNFELAVEPGNTEIERNKSLLVLARFADAIPPESTLVFSIGEEEIRLPMNKSLDDPVFGARIGSVAEPLKYWVEFAEQKSEQFEVSVFDYPEMVRADATLQFPEYTKLSEKVVQDVRRVSAVEGTGVELSFYVNKELADAKLTPADTRSGAEEAIALQRDSVDPRLWTAKVEMQDSRKFELKLVDAEGRENRIPPKLILNALKNQLPDLKLTAPRRDVEVSAIEELELAVSAWDDFGLNLLGLNYEIPGKQQNELVLLENAVAKKRHEIDHLLEFELLGAEPDQLLTYYFWAEDIGPDGQPRRVQSDMYFAEVRHFEEIFRQGQAPPGGQQPGQQQSGQGQNGQNAEKAQELAELQKEIINATWTLIRRETKSEMTKEFDADSALLVESQQTALQQVEEGLDQVEDATSRAYLEQVVSYMNEAIVHLSEAKSNADAQPLDTALTSEKAAYQGLLKLRAREHEVIRQQRQQGQQGQQSASRQQQQMEQLNLEEDENRYEQERTAAEQQSTEAREDRQVLNRLRELARRQEDLNDRIKELQSALEKAETREEKEEIEDRLKSLREQQEQLLRDTDELIERMQQPENQQRMSEQAEQLEQARENIREASEALEQGKTSQAAAEGTRAQRDLEELRDEFQNRTAGQFTEQMRQLRNEAQDLEQKQEQISEELNQIAAEKPDSEQPPSLLDEEETPDLANQLQEQQQGVEEVRRKMRETIEEAEAFEPLLAEELYDTYRKSERSRPDQALESARESFERGWADDAKVEERKARAGITEMREGIERAAESVLGDETEALRAAQETLESLNERLQEELDRAQAQNDGQQSDQDSSGQSQPGEQGESQEGQGQPGQAQNGDPNQQNQQPSGEQPGQGQGQQPQDGQPQNEQSQSGQGQSGQNPEGQNQPSDQPQNQDSQNQTGQNQNGQQPGQGGGGGRQNQDDPSRDGQPGQPRQEPGERQRLDQPEDARPQSQPGRDRQGGNASGRDFRGGFDPWRGDGNLRTMERIFGEDFREFSDQMRDVEEMIADPELRSEAARIREEARQIRIEQKRHAAEPNWDLVKLKVAKPLAELQDRVAEELIRRTTEDALVPLDRDPVPSEYQDAVRKYYERIGRGQ